MHADASLRHGGIILVSKTFPEVDRVCRRVYVIATIRRQAHVYTSILSFSFLFTIRLFVVS